jgi:hypothetical protein
MIKTTLYQAMQAAQSVKQKKISEWEDRLNHQLSRQWEQECQISIEECPYPWMMFVNKHQDGEYFSERYNSSNLSKKNADYYYTETGELKNYNIFHFKSPLGKIRSQEVLRRFCDIARAYYAQDFWKRMVWTLEENHLIFDLHFTRKMVEDEYMNARKFWKADMRYLVYGIPDALNITFKENRLEHFLNEHCFYSTTRISKRIENRPVEHPKFITVYYKRFQVYLTVFFIYESYLQMKDVAFFLPQRQDVLQKEDFRFDTMGTLAPQAVINWNHGYFEISPSIKGNFSSRKRPFTQD